MVFPGIAMRTGTGPVPTMENLHNYATFDKALLHANERRKATADGRGWGGKRRTTDVGWCQMGIRTAKGHCLPPRGGGAARA